MHDVMGATVSNLALWMRPVAAVSAGFLADKLSATKTVSTSFALLFVFYAAFAMLPPSPDTVWLLWLQALSVAAACFALRGV